MKYHRIQDLREDYFYTQDYVAKILGISQRSYSYYERGERSIPLEILIAIADLYEVSTDYLLERTNERHICGRKI
ncbi:MAG: helix-turn-helix transcriptional regulator [Lachnospiraceae bacterium]|nr:helix-turn-helix transcriptional regulator [Lachnospiraceae bacterium]